MTDFEHHALFSDTTDVEFSARDHQSQCVDITPEIIALLSLADCRDQLAKSVHQPGRMLLASKAAHLALQSSLTAALSGSAGIGAHPEKLRTEYLAFLHSDMRETSSHPKSDRVMYFNELLESALLTPLPWTNESIILNEQDKKLLSRLSEIRHAVEHVKQTRHSMKRAYILASIAPAIALTTQLMRSVQHHFEESEIAEMDELFCEISTLLNFAT